MLPMTGTPPYILIVLYTIDNSMDYLEWAILRESVQTYNCEGTHLWGRVWSLVFYSVSETENPQNWFQNLAKGEEHLKYNYMYMYS